MGGNVWEWTNDWYYEPSLNAPKASALDKGNGKVVKGGDWGSEARPAFSREWNRVDARSLHGGFRCAEVRTCHGAATGQDGGDQRQNYCCLQWMAHA